MTVLSFAAECAACLALGLSAAHMLRTRPKPAPALIKARRR